MPLMKHRVAAHAPLRLVDAERLIDIEHLVCADALVDTLAQVSLSKRAGITRRKKMLYVARTLLRTLLLALPRRRLNRA
jgi:hypothetical protein